MEEAFDSEILLCSKCFENHGLERQASAFGKSDKMCCPNCNSVHGFKLDRKASSKVAYSFFVRGSYVKTSYGQAPLFQLNSTPNADSVSLPPQLQKDADLLSLKLGISFSYHTIKLWMLGEVEPLKKLQSKRSKDSIIKRILKEYPSKLLTQEDVFYKVRTNPQYPDKEAEYDSSPVPNGAGRMHQRGKQTLYTSEDLDTCIHECRVSADDTVYCATLSPQADMHLLDLTVVLKEECTSCQSLDMAVHLLFLAGSHSYKITQEIAAAALDYGYQGVAYPSYFTWLRMGIPPLPTAYGLSYRSHPNAEHLVENMNIQNYAIFGRPIEQNLLAVKSINRVVLRRVEYEYSLGPVI